MSTRSSATNARINRHARAPVASDATINSNRFARLTRTLPLPTPGQKYSISLPVTAPLKSSLITYQFIHGGAYNSVTRSLGALESFQFSPCYRPPTLAANCLNILPLITPSTRDTRNDRAIWRTIFHGVVRLETKSSERIGGALVTGHFATSRDLYAYPRCLYFPQALIHERCSVVVVPLSSRRKSNPSNERLSLSLSFFHFLFSPPLSLLFSFSRTL